MRGTRGATATRYRTVLPPTPLLDLRFAETKSLTDEISGNNLITFTRNSTATSLNASGSLVTAAINEPRFDHSPTTGESLGLLIEEQRTNEIRNNTMVGASVGTPGALPTNWSFYTGITGVSRSIVGVGTVNGIKYIDVRFSGTASAAGELSIYPEAAGIAMTAGTVISSSTWLAIVGGSTSNARASLRVISTNSGSYMSETNITASLTSSLTRFSTNNYSTASGSNRSQPSITVFTLAAGSIDITIRIGLPQLERGSFTTSVIPTTSTSVTRAADVASMSGSNFSSFYNNTGSTILAFGRSLGLSTGNECIAGVDSQADGAQIRETASQMIGMFRTSYGADAESLILPSGLRKMAIAYAPSIPGVFTMNGSIFTSGTNASSSLTLPTRLGIGCSGDLTNQWNGTITRIAYWPSRILNLFLSTITR